MKKQILISLIAISAILTLKAQTQILTSPVYYNSSNNNVGIDITNPNAKFEVGVQHTLTQDQEMRIGSYYSSLFYGIGLNYRLDGYAPSTHIVNYTAGTRYTSISLVNEKVGIGVTNPNAKFEVGVQHTSTQDQEMRIGSYYNNLFYGIGLNYRIDQYAPSTHIVSYTGGTRYTSISLVNEKVGIGTAPSFKFQVKGNANSDSMTLGATTAGSFALTDANGGPFGLFAGISNSGKAWLQVGRYDTNTANDLILQSSGGNVGIGTIIPAYKLDVNVG